MRPEQQKGNKSAKRKIDKILKVEVIRKAKKT